MLVGEAIESIMGAYNIKDQYAMAKTLGVSQGTISNYIKGTTYPTLLVAARIYGEYGYRVEPFTEKALKKEWEYIKETL